MGVVIGDVTDTLLRMTGSKSTLVDLRVVIDGTAVTVVPMSAGRGARMGHGAILSNFIICYGEEQIDLRNVVCIFNVFLLLLSYLFRVYRINCKEKYSSDSGN